jgi:protein TonB
MVLPARNLAAFGMAALVTLGLFWLMHYLVLNTAKEMTRPEPFGGVDFVRVKRDTDLETRQRTKPEKPPPPKNPPPPQLKVQAPQPQQQNPTPFNLPNLNLAANVTGGPFLGNFQAANLSGDGELIPILRIAPQYPRQAAREGLEGTVTVEVVVGPDGTVRSARVVKSQPRGYFEQAALQSARKSKFRPKIVDGTPVEQTGTYDVVFSLDAN